MKRICFAVVILATWCAALLGGVCLTGRPTAPEIDTDDLSSSVIYNRDVDVTCLMITSKNFAQMACWPGDRRKPENYKASLGARYASYVF